MFFCLKFLFYSYKFFQPEAKLSRVNSLGRINENNTGKFQHLMAKTNNEESIFGSRKVNRARVHSSFSINNMYEPESNQKTKRPYK